MSEGNDLRSAECDSTLPRKSSFGDSTIRRGGVNLMSQTGIPDEEVDYCTGTGIFLSVLLLVRAEL